MVESVIAERGRIDLLVNNAAAIADRLLAMMAQDDWDPVMNTGLNGLYGTTQPTAKQMTRQRTGRIVNVASVSRLAGIAGQTNYSAAKAAVIGFTRSLAKELAHLGICVNAVAPGFVDAERLASFSPEQHRDALARVPAHAPLRPTRRNSLPNCLPRPRSAAVPDRSDPRDRRRAHGLNISFGFSAIALHFQSMPVSDRRNLAASTRPAPPESEALRQLRRGEITLDEYLDYQADIAVAHLKGLVDSGRLQGIRSMIREQMASDPVLVEQLRRTTGLDLDKISGFVDNR